jgi:hypothetical protein
VDPSPRFTLAFATTDNAAAEWTFQGQYTGQLQGLPLGEGQPVSIRGVNVLTLLRDDQIVEEHIYMDLAAILGQLGLLPAAPGTPAAWDQVAHLRLTSDALPGFSLNRR